jgi:hypothetical protein
MFVVFFDSNDHENFTFLLRSTHAEIKNDGEIVWKIIFIYFKTYMFVEFIYLWNISLNFLWKSDKTSIRKLFFHFLIVDKKIGSSINFFPINIYIYKYI